MVEVIAYCDRLERNFRAVTDGNRVRALCMAMVACEITAVSGSDACRKSIPGGLPFLDAVLIVLRDRLAGATTPRPLAGGLW